MREDTIKQQQQDVWKSNGQKNEKKLLKIKNIIIKIQQKGGREKK